MAPTTLEPRTAAAGLQRPTVPCCVGTCSLWLGPIACWQLQLVNRIYRIGQARPASMQTASYWHEDAGARISAC